MPEWLKGRDWKSRVRFARTGSSNLPLSADFPPIRPPAVAALSGGAGGGNVVPPVNLLVTLLVLAVSAVGSFVFATLAYSLRDYSRATLGEWLDRRARRGGTGGGTREPGRGDASVDVSGSVSIDSRPASAEAARQLDAVVEHEEELALTAAVARTASNIVLALAAFDAARRLLPVEVPLWGEYGIAFAVTLLIVGLVGVLLPLAISNHAAEPFIGRFSTLLRVKRIALLPVAKLHGPVDRVVRRAAGRAAETPEHVEEEIEKEIMDIVDEGRDEGVIGEAERQMIERALRFQDTSVGQAMTPRGDVVGLPIDATAGQVLRVIDDSGYSRIPVYRDSLDHVEGVLYARDLFRYVGKRLDEHGDADGDETTSRFDLAGILRRPLVVPETKPLSDLLRDMQLQKIHMAIVLDEYGGTSGLVTIEDVLEELVGEIVDEHEEDEAPNFHRVDDRTAEADARVEIEAVNRLMGLDLPTDAGYDTLGGFVTSTLGRIPPAGTTFEHADPEREERRAIFTVLDAEPQRVSRVRIELPRPADDAPAGVEPALNGAA